MEVTGTVTRRLRRRTPHGSTYVTVWLTRDGQADARLCWLHTAAAGPEPARGQRVTVAGVAMMLHRSPVNVGAAQITIHETSG